MEIQTAAFSTSFRPLAKFRPNNIIWGHRFLVQNPHCLTNRNRALKIQTQHKMELNKQTHVAAVSASSRPLANYHPNIWGDRFLLHISPSDVAKAREEQLVAELVEEAKRELKEASNDYMRILKMVDAIQRLGIEYHFEEEIDQALQNLFEAFHDYCKDSMTCTPSLLVFAFSDNMDTEFHVVTKYPEIFDKFKDDKGGFKVPNNIEEVTGMLEFFEATHLRVHGEDVLDHGFVFSRNYMESVLPSLSGPVAKQVHYALRQYSLRRGFTRLHARHYISIYEQYDSHHQGLLTLAKLDFNLLQSMHKRELCQIYRWWKDLEVATKLSYARDRMVETYFWISGVYFEPKYALARKILTKLQAVASLLDDTYDAYGTFEELQLFTEAIERWSFSCLDQLPDHMKIVYQAILEIFEEIEEEMIKQGTSYRTSYGIEAMKAIARANFAEIKWREAKYKPTVEEIIRITTEVAASLTIISFLGMEDHIATKEAFDWVLSLPGIVRAYSIVGRLSDDIAGHEFEREREHIPSSIECYTEEHSVLKQEAVYEFNNQIETAWKDINEAFLRPTKIPSPLLYRILNFARAIEVFYSNGDDWYTHVGPEMQSFINQLLIQPVP